MPVLISLVIAGLNNTKNIRALLLVCFAIMMLTEANPQNPVVIMAGSHYPVPRSGVKFRNFNGKISFDIKGFKEFNRKCIGLGFDYTAFHDQYKEHPSSDITLNLNNNLYSFFTLLGYKFSIIRFEVFPHFNTGCTLRYFNVNDERRNYDFTTFFIRPTISSGYRFTPKAAFFLAFSYNILFHNFGDYWRYRDDSYPTEPRITKYYVAGLGVYFIIS